MPSGVPHTSSCVLPHGDDGDAAVPPRLPAPEGADRSLDGCYGPYPSGSSEADARSSPGSPSSTATGSATASVTTVRSSRSDRSSCSGRLSYGRSSNRRSSTGPPGKSILTGGSNARFDVGADGKSSSSRNGSSSKTSSSSAGSSRRRRGPPLPPTVTTLGLSGTPLAARAALARQLLSQSVTRSTAATTLNRTEAQAHSVLAVVSAATSSPKAATTSARTMYSTDQAKLRSVSRPQQPGDQRHSPAQTCCRPTNRWSAPRTRGHPARAG